jgi:hypothetical protein
MIWFIGFVIFILQAYIFFQNNAIKQGGCRRGLFEFRTGLGCEACKGEFRRRLA